MKKIIAGVCAGALSLSLAVPAFASNMTNDNSVTFSGVDAKTALASTATVSVKLRKTGNNLYINPYGVSYDLGKIEVKDSSSAAFDTTKDVVLDSGSSAYGFFTDTMVIQNNSESKLGVSVTLTTGAYGSNNVEVTETKPTTAQSYNLIYGHFEIAPVTVTTGSETVATDGAGAKGTVSGVTVLTPKWDDAAAKKDIVIPEGYSQSQAGTPKTADTGFVIDKATSKTDMSGNKTTTPAYAVCRLAGDAILAQDTDSWPTADTVDVTVALKFTPVTG